MSLASAKQISGLRAVFGEVYPDPVRVVSVGATVDELLAAPASDKWKGLSIEFCGGTHLANTKEAGSFALLSEEGIAKGIRRIVGLTMGAAATAIALGDELAARVAAAGALSGPALDKELAAIKGVVATAAVPAPRKAELNASINELTRRTLEAAKAAAGANKNQAVAAVAAAAKDAAAAGTQPRMPPIGPSLTVCPSRLSAWNWFLWA